MKFLLIMIGIIACLNLIGFVINKAFYSHELEGLAPYGQMTEVNGHKMHVYSMGNAEKTIVLLPGLGVPLPSADFGPLMRALSKEYTVVCVEYFGVGFSEQTQTPRTNENYTEEIRAALSQCGYQAPYILMPHSASGVYCEYYAAKYPQEISAVIMLDTTSTAFIGKGNVPKFVYGIAKLQQACGVTKLTASLAPPAQKTENGYTEKEIAEYRLFLAHTVNDTFIDQSYLFTANITEVNAIPFPQNIPVLKIVSTATQKSQGTEYQLNHLQRLGPNAASVTVDATHFLYQTRTTEIVEAAKVFLDKTEQ